MADKAKIIKPVKGINLDAHPSVQPDGTTRMVYGAVVDEDLGNLTSEKGVEKFTLFNDREMQVGEGLLIDGAYILFTCPTPYVFQQGGTTCRVLYVDKDDKVTELLKHDELGFNPQSQIRMRFKVSSSNNHIIMYWVDGRNPDRWLDVTDALENPSNYTSIDLSTISLHATNLKVPKIELKEILETGGILKTGVYELVLAYQDKSGSTTNYLNTSGIIPIVPKPVSVTSVQSHNEVDFVEGAAPDTLTSRAIRFTISNLDRNYYKLVCGIRKTINGINSTFIFNTFIITGGSMDITYYGNENIQEVDAATFIVPTIQYDHSTYIELFNDELYLANLEAKTELNWQSYINEAKVHCIHSPINLDKIKGSYKDELLTENGKSFLEDEIYPLAIRGIFKNGSRTKVFHIPARLLNEANYFPNTICYDSGGGNSEDSNVDSSDDKSISNVTEPYWKVYNTGINGVGTSALNVDVHTETAFWRSSEDYPTDKDYPTDDDTKIRHHRMSDYIAPVTKNSFGEAVGYKSGFVISNLKIPKEIREKLCGFEILRGVRNYNNASVLAQGYVHLTVVTGDGGSGNPFYYSYSSHPFNKSSTINKIVQFYGVDTNFLKVGIVPGMYLKYRTKYTDSAYKKTTAKWRGKFLTPTIPDAFQATINGAVYLINNQKVNVIGLNDSITRVFENTLGQQSLLLNLAKSFPEDGDGVDRTDGSDGAYYTTEKAEAYHTYIKRVIENQYGSLEDVTYVNAGVTVLDLQESDFDNNDIYIPSKFSSISRTGGLRCFGGDVFVGNYGYRRSGNEKYISGTDIDWQSIIEVYSKSLVNINFRHNEFNDHYYVPRNDYEDLWGSEIWKGNLTSYNKDYSKDADLFLAIADKDDKVFNTKFHNRIVVSQKDLGESDVDNNRVFLANDYVDIPQEKGEITGIFLFANKLFAQTKQSTYDTNANFQSIQTNESNLYIGTGQRFSLQANEVLTTKEGQAGSLTYEATVVTSSGVYFIDYNSNEVYLLNGNIQPLGVNGLMNFFKEFTKFRFWKEARTIIKDDAPAIEYKEISNPANPCAVGYVAIFDKESKRILITKRDVKIKNDFVENYTGIYDGIGYDEGLNIQFDVTNNWFVKFTVVSGFPDEIVPLSLDNTTYFEDMSFTLSFSLINNAFTSFHKYYPTNYLLTPNYTLAHKNKYGESPYGYKLAKTTEYNMVFDDVKSDFIVELGFIPDTIGDKLWTWLEVILQTDTLTSGNVVNDRELFFNKLWVYNHYQGSNEITLTRGGNLERVENKWRINEFYDKLNDAVSNIFTLVGVDKEFEPSSFPAKSWYEEGHFVSPFLIVRFILNNSTSQKVSVSLCIANYKDSKY